MYSAQQEWAFVDLAWPPKLTRSASKGHASQKSCCWSNSIICMWLCWSGYSLVRPLLALRVSLADKDHPGIRYEPITIDPSTMKPPARPFNHNLRIIPILTLDQS